MTMPIRRRYPKAEAPKQKGQLIWKEHLGWYGRWWKVVPGQRDRVRIARALGTDDKVAASRKLAVLIAEGDKQPTLLELLTRAVGEQFTGDPIRAGVVLAFVPDGVKSMGSGCYLSICRYTSIESDGKKVIFSRYASSFEDAVSAAAEWFFKAFIETELRLRDLRLAMLARHGAVEES
jgi:hypothetical protein